MSSDAGTTSYSYDVHGRLKTVTAPNGADQSVTTYSYDNTGNRQTVAITSSDTTPPNPPTNPSATAFDYQTIQLSWTTSLDVGGGPVSYYRVYRSLQAGQLGSVIASPNGPPYPQAAAFNDFPLAANTTYYYRISAVDPALNESVPSAQVGATTPAQQLPDTTPPSVPGNFQGAAVSGTQINLSWNASTDTGGSGLAGYEVLGGTTCTSVIASPSGTSYAVQSLTPATTYQYQVRAYDGAGNRSGCTNSISVTTLDTIAPSAPGNPTFGTPGATTVTANWTAAGDNVGVTGYRYSFDGGSSWTTLGNVLTTNLTGLSLGTPYTMLLQARDAAGNWGPSSSGSFTTASYYTDSLTFSGGSWTGSNPTTTGFLQGALGGLTPSSTISGGKQINDFYNELWANCVPEGCQYDFRTYLVVTGFVSTPAATWLQTISLPGGGTLTGSSAVFSCTSGTCSWFWPTYVDLSPTYTLTIVHQ